MPFMKSKYTSAYDFTLKWNLINITKIAIQATANRMLLISSGKETKSNVA